MSKMNELVENGKQHRRRGSMGRLIKDEYEELSLFQDMQKQELSNFLHLSNEDVEASLRDESLKSGTLSEQGSTDLLIADLEKTDYDWLITPPETPLFPSLDQEVPVIILPKQDVLRSLSPQKSKYLGRHSSFSVKTSKGFPNMKRANSFSISNNESSSIKLAPSKEAMRVRSQPSTPSRSTYMRTAEGDYSHPSCQTVTRSLGTHPNGKVTPSARCTPSARQVSPLKKPQPPHREIQHSFPSVPHNLRTSFLDRSSCRPNTSQSRHKRNASVVRISSNSTWMATNSHLRWPTVSTSPSISCSSSASLDRECLSPNSSRDSATSPYDEVCSFGSTVGLRSDRRRISRSYDGEFTQLSTLHSRHIVTPANHKSNPRPVMPELDSPVSCSSSISSALQSSSCSNSILNFTTHSEKSDSYAQGDSGIFRSVHNNLHIKQVEESSIDIKEKDDLQIEASNIQNHEGNLSVSDASDFDYLLASEDNPLAHNTMAVESVKQVPSLLLPEKTELASVQEEQLASRRWTGCTDAEGNIYPPNAFTKDSCKSNTLNRQDIPKILCTSESDGQRPSVLSELPLNLKDDKLMEKLELSPRLEQGNVFNIAPISTDESLVDPPGSAKGIMESNSKVKPSAANQVFSDSDHRVIDEPASMCTSWEGPFACDSAACSFEGLKKSSFTSPLSVWSEEGKRDVLSGQRLVANKGVKEPININKSSLSSGIRQEGCIIPTSISDELISKTSQARLLIEERAMTGMMNVQDVNIISLANELNSMTSEASFLIEGREVNDMSVQDGNVLAVPKSIKIGEQSLLSSGKQSSFKDRLIHKSDCSNSGAEFVTHEEVQSSAAANVVNGKKSEENNKHEKFAQHGLESSQQPKYSSFVSNKISLAWMETQPSVNSHSSPCLEVETELAFSGSCLDVKDGSCCKEENFPVTGREMCSRSDMSYFADDCENKDIISCHESHFSEKNKATLLDLQELLFSRGETVNLDDVIGRHSTTVTMCGGDVLANTTTACANDGHDEQANHGAGMLPLEPQLSRCCSDAQKHECSFHRMNAPQSGDSIDEVCAPSPSSDTAVPRFSSSILQDRRFLETADAILFCSSIVHDIIYEASNIAIEKEASSTVGFQAATKKDLPLFFKDLKKSHGTRKKAAKGCKTQAECAEQISRQKLIYMQQQNGINSTVVSHPENSAMQIDLKQQEERVQPISNNNQSKEVPRNDKSKCSCTIL